MIQLSPKLLVILAIVFLLGLILGVFLLWKIRQLFLRWKIRRQHSTAKRGENDAEDLLMDAGYTVIERQARTLLQILFDGTPWGTDIIADLIVEKDGLMYIAEVKTGAHAPDIRSAPTRRQLLEYYVTYRPDGILLVDMTAHKIHTVEFLLHEK